LDLAKLAQKQTNTKVKFELMSIQQAQAKRIKFNKFFAIDITNAKT
jgi:allophanate hydrolase subunit 2